MSEKIFEIGDTSLYKRICGMNDGNIKKIESILKVSIIPRGNMLKINTTDEQADSVLKLFHIIADLVSQKDESSELDDFEIRYLASMIKRGRDINASDLTRLTISVPDSGRRITPRTINQADYIHSIFNRSMTFGIGPAGTGKTFLAVVSALYFLLNGKCEKIILTRPAVEAGESLGFLPGDLTQKINPYLRPLYDALFEMLNYEKTAKLIERGAIEIAPLAYMRGRTLNKAFIILDEAQNTSKTQMKMFLTRLGNNSRIVISGDETQIDLEKKSSSGLLHAMKLLKNINDISFIMFTKEDISRHPLVEKIVEAYEKEGINK